MIRVLIVDDELLARVAIRNMLGAHSDVEIVGECEGGAAAVDSTLTLAPDLVFLDVQMPEIDGFGVIEAVGPARMPRVIFVTAYDQYAVRAFEVHALDYLLKPFDHERLGTALERARRQLRQDVPDPEWSQRVLALLGEGRGESADRFILRHDGRVIFLAAAEIDWIESQGNYVNLHGGAHTYLFRESTSSLEARLDARRFRRINRSTIVNVDSIRELRPRFHGDYEVILRDGTALKLSHRYRANLERNAFGGL